MHLLVPILKPLGRVRDQGAGVGELRFEFFEWPLQVCHGHFSRRSSAALSRIFTSSAVGKHAGGQPAVLSGSPMRFKLSRILSGASNVVALSPSDRRVRSRDSRRLIVVLIASPLRRPGDLHRSDFSGFSRANFFGGAV